MGFVLAKIFDPPSPDTTCRDFWHIKGVIMDSQGPSEKIQRRPAGVLYVYDSRLIYKPRRCTCSRNAKQLQLKICDIQNVNDYNKFTSHNNGKTYSNHVIDVMFTDGPNSLHVGFITNDAEDISRRLNEICIKHRQKPKIFQFNSVDVEGVEIDLP
uniref:Uncharacterized protein n=1 Tax=Acrobeloides nanus TaxID=290746 RepID=A0A914BV44_9BILA